LKGWYETAVEIAAFGGLFAASANVQAMSEMADKRGRERAIVWRKGKIPTYTTWPDRQPHIDKEQAGIRRWMLYNNDIGRRRRD
jgi:hypothetical protein